jgi:phosphoglycolate phosphatase
VARTLLFDLDGTLVDTVPDLAAALNRLMGSRGLPVFSRDAVAAMVGDGVGVLVSRAFATHGKEPDAAAVAELTSDYTAHVAVESNVYPHVIPILQGLVQRGWRLAVCTNKPELAATVLLQALGVLPFLCAVGGGDSFPVRKPDPRHLLQTLALAGGSVDRAVLVGDHRNDVSAARGAGIPCVFAAWGYGSASMAEGCAHVAQDIAEAATIADQLLPAAA